MFTDYQYMLLQDRTAREQDLAERMAERRRYARSPGEPSLRARLARRLFALAVATEREETWRQVWERLEARGRLQKAPLRVRFFRRCGYESIGTKGSREEL
jgi:hypothetical protein